jgi:hypothetical protein
MGMPARTVTHFVTLLAALSMTGCSPKYAYKENTVPELVTLSPRLQNLFGKTKLLCFGRYAVEVPREAEIIWGSSSFPSRIETIQGDLAAAKRHAADAIGKLKWNDRTAEITYDAEGPIQGSWQIRYYEGKIGKEMGLHHFRTYINKNELTFVLRGTRNKAEPEIDAAARQADRVRSLRLRDDDEVPTEPGYCIEKGFIADSLYGNQEMVSVGLHFPSFPDVTFSISSNKDAYGDYPPEEFEKTERAELSLLARIKKAQHDQGALYPSKKVLREGKRDVQHWHGEESLIKRKDGSHDFEWALVGKPKDVANPSEFNAQMFTKVEHNTVGAARSASLIDDEAVALWDKLLSGLRFRVKVPGAPPGSYYFPQANQQERGTM